MNFSIKILLILLLCIGDYSLNTAGKLALRDTNDYDLQERDYQTLLAKSQADDDPHENDYTKMALISDGGHRSPQAYVGARNKLRMRHSRNGKLNRNRLRLQNSENRMFDYAEPRNALQNSIAEYKQQPRFVDDDNDNNEDISVEATLAGLNDPLLSRFPYKKRTAVRRWPLKKLRKFYALNEKSKAQNMEHHSGNKGASNPDNSENYENTDETNSKANNNKDNEMPDISSDGNYVLVPEPNQLIVVKNLSLAKAMPVTQNKRSDNAADKAGNRRLIMTIQSDSPHHFNGLASERARNEGGVQSCKGINPKGGEDENDEFEAKNLPDESDSDGGSMNESDAHLRMKVKEEIVNCTASGVDKYFKLFERKNEPKTTGGGKPDVVGSSRNESSRLVSQHGDLMNLNITIHGLVMNNDGPSKVHGNGTIRVNAAAEEEARKRRASKFFKKLRNRKGKEEEGSDDDDDENASKLEDDDDIPIEGTCGEVSKPDAGLTPDKLSNEIVKMVSHMVRSNPCMKKLWPSLKQNRPSIKSSACNLRTTADCSGRKKIEEMLRKAMESVNEIIKKEVQSRSCVPLSEDLAEFYEIILEMHAKQAKRKEEREEMLIQAENLDKEPFDGDEEFKPKKKPCKPIDDADLREDALFDMMHLRRLQYDNEISEVRRRREAAKRRHVLIRDTANSSLVRKLRQMYSPAFLKLNSVVDSLERAEEEDSEQL